MNKTCTLGLCLALAAPAHAVPNDIFAIGTIGDSLSDTGNLSGVIGGSPPAGLYYGDAGSLGGTGVVAEDAWRRFSNGPVWVERLENLLGGTPEFDMAVRAAYEQSWGATVDQGLGLPGGSVGTIESSDPLNPWLGFNQAFGGAQTNGTLFGGLSLQQQGQFHADFLRDGIPSFNWPAPTTDQRDRTLYVVQGGGNDFFNITGPGDIPVVLQGAVDALGSIITDLADAGASNFLVPNLPGYIVADDWVTATPADVRSLSQAFNGLLASELADLRTNLGVEIVEVDWFALFDEIAANPAHYGLTNISQPCLDFDAGLGLEGMCGNPDEYMMYDALHPNAAVHQAMAEAAYVALQENTAPVPLPAGWLLMGPALIAVARARRHPSEA
ncbi:MAG: SGNH/GDSL hydrolase family protein [Gammaproteobacteria bacterium]|nr:SGNH/GDSL hydrolase family protein [Gammaproteobacteria bacterium]